MKFNFKDKAKVSLGDEADYVVVKFWGAPYILTEEPKPVFKEPFALRVRIPLQTDAESSSVIATQVMADTVGDAGSVILWIQFVARILFSGAMNDLLGMLGFMQLVVYLPLLDLKFPPTALLLYNQITNIVTFDLLPTDSFYPYMFDFPEFTSINESFEDFDFKRFFIINLGSLWIVITVTLIQFPLYYCAKCCGIKKIVNYYKESQFWGTPLDVIMGSYLEICFACLINYILFTTEGETYSYGVWINNIYLFAGSILVVAYPVWLYFFLKKNYYNL